MTVERHDFTTTPECPWCGERECERHCAECGRERFYRDGRHMGEAVEMDECAVKHCDQVATLGMTWNFEGVRVEFYVCEEHFDAIDAARTNVVEAPEKGEAS